MYEERNTGTNLPAEIEISAVDGDAYKFLFMAKGGGSANKSYLFQETKALLNPTTLLRWVDEKIRTLGTAACPPYHLADRHRRHLGGVRAEDRQAGLRPLPRHPADDRQRAGPGVPRRRARGRGPRRSRSRPASAPSSAASTSATTCASSACRATARRARWASPCQLLGRPPGARQDHRGRRLPRAAGDRPGPLPARAHRRAPRRRRRPHRPEPADGGDPGRAVPLPDPHPAVAERADGRRPRHRPRQAQGAPRRRRAAAAVLAGPLRLLRRPGQDPRRLRLRLVRADHRGADGLLRRRSSRPPAARSSCWPRATAHRR